MLRHAHVSFTSTPDNALVSLTYTDPATGQNQTCTDSCSLSTDPNLAVQDYIFTNGPKDLTGFRMDLTAWIGGGAGLSSVQLLSNGKPKSSGVTQSDLQEHLGPPSPTPTSRFARVISPRLQRQLPVIGRSSNIPRPTPTSTLTT
jgi:hypothetical protein